MSEIVLAADERLDTVNANIKIIQKKDGLKFGTDAYMLASFIKQQKYSSAVELGTGTGIISLLCAGADKFASIDAFEIQDDFAEIAKKNVLINGLESKIRIFNRDIRNISASFLGYEVDAVFTNPPYMSTDSGKRNVSDRKYIARHEVCGDINDFCRAAYRLLKHGGKFYCVWRPDRLSSLMAAMRNNRIEPKIMMFVHADECSAPSMVLVSATKEGAEGLRVMPPMFLYGAATDKGGEREMSERAHKIYDTMSTSEV